LIWSSQTIASLVQNSVYGTLIFGGLTEEAKLHNLFEMVTGLSLEAGYCRSSGSCESSSHRLLGHVCQQILQKYNS